MCLTSSISFVHVFEHSTLAAKSQMQLFEIEIVFSYNGREIFLRSKIVLQELWTLFMTDMCIIYEPVQHVYDGCTCWCHLLYSPLTRPWMTADTLTQLWMIVISETIRDRYQLPQTSFHTETFLSTQFTRAVTAAGSVAFLNSISQGHRCELLCSQMESLQGSNAS